MSVTATVNTARETSNATLDSSMPQIPLAFLEKSKEGTVLKVRGRDEQHHHLENLGFVAGAKVRVASQVAGDLIVEVKGARVALSKSIAMKIIVAA